MHSGATPLFVDISMDDYNIDLNKLEYTLRRYNSRAKKIKALIAVDYAGNPCDWKSLRYLADKFKIKLINDNCHALGAKYQNNKHYAIKYADVITQSFHPLKNITTGEGGAVLSNNENFIKKIKLFRSHHLEFKKKNYWNPDVTEIGFNYRITDFQCALGVNQLKKVDKLINKKNQIAKTYDNFFSKYKYFKVPKVRKSDYHAYHLYPLLIDFKKINISKNNLFNYFQKENFRLQVHYKPIHTFSLYKKKFKYKKKDFPISVDFFNKEVSIPIFPNLSKKDQKIFLYKFEKLIRKFF